MKNLWILSTLFLLALISCDLSLENKVHAQSPPETEPSKQNPPPELLKQEIRKQENPPKKEKWTFSSLEPGPWQTMAIRSAYQVLDRYFDPTKTLSEDPLLNHSKFEYERVYFTIYVNHKTRGCQSSSKGNFQQAIEQAVIETIEDPRFGGPLKAEELPQVFVSFNMVLDQRPILSRTVAGITEELDLGLDGISIVKGKKKAFFKESVFLKLNFDMKKLLERLCLKAKLSKNAYQKDSSRLYAHRMLSFVGDRTSEALSLYRYQKLIDRKEVTLQEISRRLKLARSWILDKRKEDYGFLHYEYLPTSNSFPKTNNLIRQMGTLWSIAKNANYYQDEEMRELAFEGLDYFLDFQRQEGDRIYIWPPKDSPKIAYNAFILLALCEVESYPLQNQIMDALGRGLVAQQRSDGGFDTVFREKTEAGIDFYPGEVLTALATYAEKAKKPEIYEVLKKAFPYYSNHFRNSPNTAFVPWHSQAYTILYLHTQEKQYAEFVFEINNWLIQNHQILKNPEYLDFLGGFRTQPNYSSTAFLEGVACALHLAKQIQHPEYVSKYQESFLLGLRFIFQLQYDHSDVFHLIAPEHALGGIRTSMTDSLQRIDMAQHFINALLLSENYQLVR